jgi:uncharacterized protein involved in exopolysaccharide biosynthesis
MPQDALAAAADDEIDLFKLWNTLWRSRWLIASITAAFALGSVAYALLLPPWYSANVLLAPVKDKAPGGLAGQLGGLAGLAGIGSGGTGNVEAVAVLKSRDFARAFIEDQTLLPVLFAEDWDATAGRWKLAAPPDLPQAAKFFVGNVRKVEEDQRTGLVTLSIEWKDPELAAAWADLLAVRLNDHMRQRAMAEAEANVNYLRHELESTTVVVLQQSISRLLENEMQKLMLARGNAEFAFRIIDHAEVPRLKSKPRRTLIVVLAVLLGGMLSVFVVFIRDAVRNRTGVAPPMAGTPPVRPE